MIHIYDENLKLGHKPSDISIATAGGLIIFTCWLFFNSSSGNEIVDLKKGNLPPEIAINTLIAPAAAALLYTLL